MKMIYKKKSLSLICVVMCLFFLGCSNKFIFNSNKISDNLYKFEFKIDGSKYSVPETFNEFDKNGWKLDTEDSHKIAPNKFTSSFVLKNGSESLKATFYNTSDDTVEVEKCKVCGVVLDDKNLESGVKFELPKGINNSSTKDDIIKAYGKPSNDYTRVCQYAISAQRYVEFTFNDNKKIIGIDITNMEPHDGKDNFMPDLWGLSDDTPKEECSDALEMSFKLAGNDYKIPVAVKKLKKDGWNFEDSSDSKNIVSQGSSYNVKMENANSTFRVDVMNMGDKAASIDNCYVVEIEGDQESSQDLIFPKNIKFGSTQNDVEKAYAGIMCDKKEERDYVSYTYYTDDTQQGNIKILCNEDDKKVFSITMSLR